MHSHTLTALLISVNFFYERSRRRPHDQKANEQSLVARVLGRDQTPASCQSSCSRPNFCSDRMRKELFVPCAEQPTSHMALLKKTLASVFLGWCS